VSVQPLPGLPENESGATLVLSPADAKIINIRTRTRDTASEKTQFFAEAANLFVPGPGVVNGYCRITIRPVQGQVSFLELEVPKGFTGGLIPRAENSASISRPRSPPRSSWMSKPSSGPRIFRWISSWIRSGFPVRTARSA
jgi:hypothetical protein